MAFRALCPIRGTARGYKADLLIFAPARHALKTIEPPRGAQMNDRTLAWGRPDLNADGSDPCVAHSDLCAGPLRLSG